MIIQKFKAIGLDTIEKFTAWRLNSTQRSVWYRFYQWNLTWNSLVRQWIFLEATWAKMNVLYFCLPRMSAKYWHPFKVNVNFVCVASSNFLKVQISSQNLSVIHFLWISVHFQRNIFVARVNFRNSHRQYPVMHKCNSTLNTFSSIASQNGNLPWAMRF